MTRQIEGTAVIVTGGARGIGRATVERLARAGASVAVGDLDPDLLDDVTAEFGTRVKAAHLDVTDPASWRTFLESVEDLGPWDVLVNNAGIMPLGSVLKEEDALLAHEAVTAAAVVGRPDAHKGEEVVAAVALHPGARTTPEELIAFVKTRLAPHKYPREVLILDAVPVTSVGKTDRKAVRSLVRTTEGES